MALVIPRLYNIWPWVIHVNNKTKKKRKERKTLRKTEEKKSMSELTDKMENMSMNDSTSLGKSSVSSGAPKTPVSLLQELYVRKGITPKYDLVQIEGAVHEPTFKYRVTVGELVATGCGQSKKKAKHTAAKAMLDKLVAVNQQSSGCGSIGIGKLLVSSLL